MVHLSAFLDSSGVLFELATVRPVFRTFCRRDRPPFHFHLLLHGTGACFRLVGMGRDGNVTVFMPSTVCMNCTVLD